MQPQCQCVPCSPTALQPTEQEELEMGDFRVLLSIFIDHGSVCLTSNTLEFISTRSQMTGFCIYSSIRLNSTKPCPNCIGLVGHMIPASAIMLCSVQYPLLNYGLLNHFSPLQAMSFFDHGLHIYVLIFFFKNL